MGFHRVQTEEAKGTKKTGVATAKRAQLTQLIGEWLPNGLHYLMVQRQEGRAGYRDTQLQYEFEDEDTPDVEGVTIRGVNPMELTARILDDVAEQVTGSKPSNYRVLGFVQDDEGDETEAFKLVLPLSMFRELIDDQAVDREEIALDGLSGMVNGYKALCGQSISANGKTHEQLTRYLEILPQLVESLAKLVLGHAEALGSQRPDVELELAKMAREDQQRRDEIMARLRLAKQERAAEAMSRAIDLMGPDIAAAFRSYVESRRPPEDGENASTCAHAQHLDRLFESLSAEQLGRLESIFGAEEWTLIQRARQAAEEQEFRSIIIELDKRIAERSKDEAAAMLVAVSEELGPAATADLIRLIRSARN